MTEPSGPLAAAYVSADRLVEHLFAGDVEAARETIAEIERELDAVEAES